MLLAADVAEEYRINKAEQRAIMGVHRDHRMQVQTALLAIVAQGCGVLDRQDVTSLTSPAVRSRAVATISSGLTRTLRKNRVKRISPARSPPTRRTLMPDWPTLTSRASKQAPLFPGAGRRTVPN